MSKILKNLEQIYGKKPIKPDQFGRRDALPSEIEKVINPTFEDLINQYPPREEDIWEKRT